MKKRYKRTSISQYVYLALFLVCLAGLGYLTFIAMQRIPVQDHFVLPWAAGRLWLLEGISPYDDVVVEFAQEILGQSPLLGSIPETETLIDPVTNLVFYLPFSLIPYEVSRVIWTTLLVLVVGLTGYFSLKLSGWKLSLIERIVIILFSVAWLPGVNAVLRGQLTPIIIFLLLFGISLILRGKDTQAGFILALTFGSLPTTGLVTILLIVWGISKRRWSILTAYFSGVAFMFAVTLLLLPSWVVDWLRVMYGMFGNWDWIQTPLMTLSTILPGIANVLSLCLHVVMAVYLLFLGITLMGKTGRVFIWKTLTMLVVAYLFHVKATINHLFLILPALFLVFRFWTERWRLFGRIFAWLLMVLILAGSWLLVGTDFSFIADINQPIIAVGLPVLVFLGLVWIRWWALEIPRLSFDSH